MKAPGYFASFWAALSLDESKTRPGLSPCPFRRALQDALAKAGRGKDLNKALLG